MSENKNIELHSDAVTFFERRKGYFIGWEKMLYELKDEQYLYEMTNFLHRWTFRDSFVKNTAAFSYWVMRDFETIFSISQILYGSTYHFWIILHFNNIIDPLLSLPLTADQLQRFCQKKYGVDKVNTIHHYEAAASGAINALPVGTVVSPDYKYQKVAVTNTEHEERLNHQKRYIKLMKPEFLKQVLAEKEDIVKSDFIHMNRVYTKNNSELVDTGW